MKKLRPSSFTLKACSLLLLISTDVRAALMVPALYAVDTGGHVSILDPIRIDVGRIHDSVTHVASAMAVRPSDSQVFVWINSIIDSQGVEISVQRLESIFLNTGVGIPMDSTFQGEFHALAFSPDDRLFALYDGISEIHVDSGEARKVADFSEVYIYAADFAPDGILYAVTGTNELVAVDTVNGILAGVAQLDTDIGLIGSIAFAGPFSSSMALIGTASGGPHGDISFDIDVTSGAVSNIRPVPSSLVPTGLGYAIDFHLCDVQAEDVIVEQVNFEICGGGAIGRLNAQWGQLGAGEILEADSGERLEIHCVEGTYYNLLYSMRPDPGGLSVGRCRMSNTVCRSDDICQRTHQSDSCLYQFQVGSCPYLNGCNIVSVRHAGDRNANGRPDCLVGTRWISKDYGDDDSPSEPPRLDWFETVMSVRTGGVVGGGDLQKVNHRFEYKIGPPVTCSVAPVAEGQKLESTELPDPRIGAETENFFEEYTRILRSPPRTGPMEASRLELCDLDSSGSCDSVDLEIFRRTVGTCRSEANYEPLADINGDGCVAADDGRLLFRSRVR